jgi:acetyl-CoA carboxylase biotin carboxyl carrier protein
VPLTARDVAEIARLLEESDFEELHIEHEGFKLTLKRGAPARSEPASTATAAASTAAASATSPAPVTATPTATPAARPRDSGAPAATGLLEVPAPLLGTFYRAPKPGAPPYIELGSAVQEDTIIGIIEVMKLMNTVRAGTRGTVAEILAQDGALVEYGQVLLRISPGTPT